VSHDDFDPTEELPDPDGSNNLPIPYGPWGFGDCPIEPGDIVEHIHQPDLDARRVVTVDKDAGTLTLFLLTRETAPLPIANYRTVRRPATEEGR